MPAAEIAPGPVLNTTTFQTSITVREATVPEQHIAEKKRTIVYTQALMKGGGGEGWLAA